MNEETRKTFEKAFGVELADDASFTHSGNVININDWQCAQCGKGWIEHAMYLDAPVGEIMSITLMCPHSVEHIYVSSKLIIPDEDE